MQQLAEAEAVGHSFGVPMMPHSLLDLIRERASAAAEAGASVVPAEAAADAALAEEAQLAAVEAPATEAAVEEPLELRCASCGAAPVPGRKLRKCGGCMMVRYCSTDCQRDHWAAHKEACRREQQRRQQAAAIQG